MLRHLKVNSQTWQKSAIVSKIVNSCTNCTIKVAQIVQLKLYKIDLRHAKSYKTVKSYTKLQEASLKLRKGWGHSNILVYACMDKR